MVKRYLPLFLLLLLVAVPRFGLRAEEDLKNPAEAFLEEGTDATKVKAEEPKKIPVDAPPKKAGKLPAPRTSMDSVDWPSEGPDYRPLLVKEVDGTIEIQTPFGPYRVTGGPFKDSYKIRVPMDAIKAKKPDKADAPRDVASPPPPADPAKPAIAPLDYEEIERLVVEANRHYSRRRYFEAYNVVDRLLKKYPDYARGWVMKGSLLYAQGHRDLAKKAWEHARQLEPSYPELDRYLEKTP